MFYKLKDYRSYPASLMAASLIFLFAQHSLANTTASNELGQEPVSIWVDNAPLELVVDQLASLSGRQFHTDGKLEGQVSGSFSGTLEMTLRTIAQSYPLLFDIRPEQLSVVDINNRSSTTIALGQIKLDETTKQALLADVPFGSDVVIREADVLISGHPDFVIRTADALTMYLTETSKAVLLQASSESLNNTSVDNASETLLTELQQSEDFQQATNQQAQTTQLSRPILWVNDIPGFNTF